MLENEKISIEDIYWMLDHKRWELFKEKYPNRARNLLIAEGKWQKEHMGYLYKTPEETADLILDGRLSNFTGKHPWYQEWEDSYGTQYAIGELKIIESNKPNDDSHFSWDDPLLDIARLKAYKPELFKKIQRDTLQLMLSDEAMEVMLKAKYIYREVEFKELKDTIREMIKEVEKKV